MEGEEKPDLLSTDRAVLDGYRRGEREACLKVYRFYVRDVACWVKEGVFVFVEGKRTKLGGIASEMEAENKIQEVFLKVFQPTARNGYDGLRSYRGYLLSITRNVLIDAARRNQVQQKGMARFKGEPVFAHETPESQSEEDELTALLQVWKSECSFVEQEIWRLRFEEECSLRDTAKALSMGLFKVRKLDLLLRQDILRKLRKNGYLKHQNIELKSSILRRNEKNV